MALSVPMNGESSNPGLRPGLTETALQAECTVKIFHDVPQWGAPLVRNSRGYHGAHVRSLDSATVGLERLATMAEVWRARESVGRTSRSRSRRFSTSRDQ